MLKSVYRALQLMILYSPAVGSSPLLLFPSADIHLLWWSILKGSIKRSGPCFTKLAQWIATRPDLFPGYICRELETLQVSAVTHSWAETERALLAALGPELYEKITIVDKTKYTGSGSAAQVYLGLYNHEKIAIKVLHPGIRDAMNADLDILSLITSVAELFPGVSSMSLHEGMEEFRNLLLQQLNLKSEAEALLRFRENFKGPKWEDEVRFPKPLMELTSSEVLFESFEDGCSISRYLDSDKKTKSKLANLCLDVLLKMVFEDNFVHGDLHGGNILVQKKERGASKDGISVSVIDTGISHTMTSIDRKNFIDVFYAFVRHDGDHLGQIMCERSRGSMPIIDQKGFEKGMSDVVALMHREGIEKVGVGAMMQRVFSLCYQHQVKLESRYASFIIAVSIMEGLVRQLDPDINILSKATPYIIKAALNSAIS
ncbi:unnamed protein product [Ectocarpus fasciculatus]